TNIASGTEGNIQGQCIYKLTNNVSDNKQTWDVVFANTNETVKEIAMTEGFFVNLASGSSVTFKKEQLTDYPTTQAKSQVAQREFVELSLVKGKHKSKLYFAHNQGAEQGYDIFDANKLFALTEVAEPYFLTDGNALVKEEVKELPYLATMNVRSFADDTVSFVVENIPEGYYVYLIDNGERIKMHEQIGYLTQIVEGENEDRFKVLVTKTILEDSRAASNIEITNYNREITIESEVENLEIEVYNALGQKVFATKDYNFTLNEVPAGAYLVKAFSGKVRQTQKIVVK
ncbi:MAG: T9SS type A sorting domain-containing protein, partial [Bacteroidales bacterium]|nr:T9SS type A sorting domain-containing protein [Bacteroidales bacterium]